MYIPPTVISKRCDTGSCCNQDSCCDQDSCCRKDSCCRPNHHTNDGLPCCESLRMTAPSIEYIPSFEVPLLEIPDPPPPPPPLPRYHGPCVEPPPGRLQYQGHPYFKHSDCPECPSDYKQYGHKSHTSPPCRSTCARSAPICVCPKRC